MLGVTQADLAAAAGISKTALISIETSTSDPKASTLSAIQKALEAAGVEFTNGEQPGVRLRRVPMSSKLEPLQFVSTSQLSVRFRTHDGELPVVVHVERRAIDDHFRLSKSTPEQRKALAEANLGMISKIAEIRHAARMWSEGQSSGSRFRQIVVREEDFRGAANAD